MEKETVLVLLLLKPMTKTSQLNVYGNYVIPWWVPCAKKNQFLDFCHYFDENQVKDMKIKKRNCIIIENNDENRSTKWKIQGRCFQTRTQSQIAFQDGGLKVSKAREKRPGDEVD